jgi:SAM-dependent methyltransferase
VHPEAWQYLTGALAEFRDQEITVLDLGGRDANGWHRVCELFPRAEYVTLDIEPGPGVDIVADAASWIPDREFDVVVCTEVFEHTPHWMHICTTACDALREGGTFVCTAATNPRAPHCALDGWELREGEYYDNIDPDELEDVLCARFRYVDVATYPRGDIYAKARR